MNKIKRALRNAGMTEGDINAAHIFKGYHFATHETGWHIIPFGKNAIWLGNNVADAVEILEREREAGS